MLALIWSLLVKMEIVKSVLYYFQKRTFYRRRGFSINILDTETQEKKDVTNLDHNSDYLRVI